jgi:two-component system cell cycle sensor histidine kinase/response regulator CckA
MLVIKNPLFRNEKRGFPRSLFMKEKQKTKKQLPEEASELQRRIARLEKSNTMLRKDRNALKESEHRFQLIAENIQEVFWIRDLEKNRTLYVSPAFEKVFGLTRESLYEDSDSYKKIIHPDDLDVLNRANERRRKGIYTDIQYRITRPDGQLRWINSRTFPILNEDKQVHQTVGIAHDITERKQAGESLRQSEERYRTILDEMDEGYQEVDLAGNFTFFNEAFLKIFGYSAEEMTGKNYSLFAADEKIVKKVYRAYNNMFKTRIPLKRFDWDIIRKDGARRTIEFYASLLTDSQDRPAGFRGIVRDVTDSKKAEEALRESEEKYRTILESTEEGYFEVDMAGNFTFFNQSLSRMIGYTEEEMRGMNNRAYMDQETSRKVFRAFNETYRTGVIMKYIDWELIRKDGSRVKVETSVSLRRDSSGDPVGFRGLVRDITERKRAEEALKKAFQNLQETKDMLVQSEKLAAMGRLSSGAAHEIRNPLNILSLNLQMLDIKGKLDDETRKAVDVCHTQIDRIVKIIEGLQTFSRKSEKRLSPGNIQEVIDHVLSLSAPRLKVEDVTTGVRCNTDLPQIFMDRAAMEQVFFHLISNALDAMKDREKKALKISAERKGDALLVTFSDTGHGIPEENLQKLFDPFFTTKDPDKGTGLGLSISYGIIQDHKGKIRAENNETGGSSFYIELPI